MVQSARVQEVVKGDDVSLLHQIMQDIAYNAELTRAPVLANSGDVVRFFYPLEDPDATDLIGYIGTPVGSYPASEFNVAIPGVIIDPTAIAANRGTSTFQHGLGRTVRAEITRLKLSTTGSVAIGVNTITGLASTTGLAIGQSIVMAGVPSTAIITAISGNTVTMNNNATANESNVGVVFGAKQTFYSIDEVDVFERGFPNSLNDTSGGANPPPADINLN